MVLWQVYEIYESNLPLILLNRPLAQGHAASEMSLVISLSEPECNDIKIEYCVDSVK